MLIGLSGYARVGKDTVAGVLVERYGFVRVAFADALKAIAADLDPIVSACPEIRLSDLLHWWDDDLDMDETQKLAAAWEYAKTSPEVRRFLQDLGVACRQHLDPQVWVNVAMREAAKHRRVVISDVRFHNEAKAIRLVGGEIWRVHRPGVEAVNGHVSEHDLDGYRFDRHVDNDGSIAALALTVAERLKASALTRAFDVVSDIPEPAAWTAGELRRAS